MKSYTKYYLLIMGVISLATSIGFVITALLFLFAGQSIFNLYDSSLTIMPAVAFLLLAIPLFIAFFKYKKYSNAEGEELIQYKGAIVAWNIIMMILYGVTIIGFLFVLISIILICNYIDGIQKGKYNSDGTAKVSFGVRLKETSSDFVEGTKEVLNIKSKLEKQTEALLQAQAMKENGVITEEEYNALRKKILGI